MMAKGRSDNRENRKRLLYRREPNRCKKWIKNNKGRSTLKARRS